MVAYFLVKKRTAHQLLPTEYQSLFKKGKMWKASQGRCRTYGPRCLWCLWNWFVLYHLELLFILQYVNDCLTLSSSLKNFINAEINILLDWSLLQTPRLRAQPRLGRGAGSSPGGTVNIFLEQESLQTSERSWSLTWLRSSSVLSSLEDRVGIIQLKERLVVIV